MVIKQAFAAAQLRRTSTTATGRAFGTSFFSAAMALLIAVVSADATRVLRQVRAHGGELMLRFALEEADFSCLLQFRLQTGVFVCLSNAFVCIRLSCRS